MPIYKSTGEPVDLSFLKERTPEAEAFWAAVDAMPVPRDEDEEPNDSGIIVIQNKVPVPAPKPVEDDRSRVPYTDIQEVQFQSSEDALPPPVPQP